MKSEQKVKKVQTTLQMEAVECGAASLAMIFSYHGIYIPLEQLRVECGVSRDGSKASNMLKAAEKFGLIGKGYKKEPAGLKNCTLPAIIHWNFNHFVVLEGFKNDKVYLNDPACGRKVISEEEFDQSFTGVVLTFTKSPDFKKTGNRENIFFSILKLLKGSYSTLFFIFLAGITLVVPGIIIPVFSRIFIDEVLLRNVSSWIMPLLTGMFITATLRALLTFFQKKILVKFQTKIAISGSAKFMWKLLHLPAAFFSQRYAGEIVDRIEANDTIANNISGTLTESLIDLLMIVFYLILLILYDPLLTLICVSIAVINVVFLIVTDEKLKTGNQKVLQDRGKMAGISAGGLQLIETIKAGGSESEFFQKWAGYQAKLLNSEQSLEKINALFLVIPQILLSVNYAVILLFGGLRVMEGVMSLGTLVAYQTLMVSFLSPINRMLHFAVTFQELKGDINRVNDVINYKGYEKSDQIPVTETVLNEKTYHKLQGEVHINSISFGYNILEAPLIKDFSMTIKPSLRIALVGGSGSGKSTLSKIISGLYTTWSGEILFDGISRENISKYILSASISMVDQDISMFEGSIRDNITLWDSTIKEEDIIQAAKDACIHEDIMARPGGYLHFVEEGGRNFSGGQRQRLEIARALVINPVVLIMDEATSALDPLTEKKIGDMIRRRGCSCIIIAHRLSTIRDCDEIIVLEKGKIVQSGTHEDLIQSAGAYSKLINSQ
ncbi:MAG: NHLP family bacteriocin export ABC transporter peptidase/permease/ATPase subunit [Spirochaetes bacterium GWF1_31_7]|nr:MAG: NHLP family bacteriocin export ABC transporter peptidase/permease/ATPase subunit [Spirochaetes bacterium GWE1_32_154]OHD48147.1 MAG: NHLP family bacteriocin export ABC transporter peptidase/permease/ATPase subunit [Spirochaetes bacterium GWE2_31_10]OHD50498.1 MAG: NHLP family bacteriocin export ABC transporter peptidase/permease/ATPase subunit [Spirochaetes bacterium GWF1_31_7]OHD78475.1 MAG: NHLP family bacteriocin export ABC transporter peptidase/permease/ATPase subunit [Spirochaetes b